MSWIYLITAGLFEIVWAVYLKEATLANLPVLFLILISMILSVVFLALAVRNLPIGVAYAIWTGIGVVGTCVYSGVMQGRLSTAEVLCIALILLGILGIKLSTSV